MPISIFIPKTGFLLFIDALDILNSFRISRAIESINYYFFSFLMSLYQSTIHLACKDFKSDNFDGILTSVGSLLFISKPVIIFVVNK